MKWSLFFLVLAACTPLSERAEDRLGPGAVCRMLDHSHHDVAECIKDGVYYLCIGDANHFACTSQVPKTWWAER